MLKGASARCPVCGDELSEEKRCALGYQLKADKKRLEGDQEAVAATERTEQQRCAALRHEIELILREKGFLRARVKK